ncbi:MAG TPA: hypothetical protein VMZ91_09395 [Candidatus Paceibacterota bacterium]|nr:hypothetical protein [Candidatus Paceibacterota bacterium]
MKKKIMKKKTMKKIIFDIINRIAMIIFLIFFVMFLIGFVKIIIGCITDNLNIETNGFKQIKFSLPFFSITFLYFLFKGALKDAKMNKKKKGRIKFG